MNLLQYNNKKVSLTDVEGKVWSGMAHYCDAESYDEDEDMLDIKVGNEYIVFSESEIYSVEILNQHVGSCRDVFIFSERRRDVNIAVVKRDNQLVDIVQKRK